MRPLRLLGGAQSLLLADRVAEEATRRAGLQYLWYPSGGHLAELVACRTSGDAEFPAAQKTLRVRMRSSPMHTAPDSSV